jgi:hypothetical protein
VVKNLGFAPRQFGRRLAPRSPEHKLVGPQPDPAPQIWRDRVPRSPEHKLVGPQPDPAPQIWRDRVPRSSERSLHWSTPDDSAGSRGTGLVQEIADLIEDRPDFQRRVFRAPVLDENGDPVLDENGEPKTRLVIQRRVKIGVHESGATLWSEWEDEEGHDYTEYDERIDEVRDRADDFRDIRGVRTAGDDGVLGTDDDVWVGGLDDEYRDLDRLIKQIEGTGEAVDRDEAERVAARMLGFENFADYQVYQQGLLADEAALRGGTFDALGAEERARREGRFERHLQRMDESYAHILGGIMAETGSSARYLMAADEAIRRQIELVDGFEESLNTAEDLARKQAWEEVRGAYQFAVNSNQAIQKDVIDQLYSSRVAAAQAQSQKIGLMVQQYSAEADALYQWADIQFKAVEMDLGLQQHIMDQMDAMYERDLRPWKAQLEALGLQMELAEAQAQIDLAEAQADLVEAETDALEGGGDGGEGGDPDAGPTPEEVQREEAEQFVGGALITTGLGIVGTAIGAAVVGAAVAAAAIPVAAAIVIGAVVAFIGALFVF